jgi:hypothetical protein
MAMGLTAAKDAKREALIRDHMAPIARIAKLEAAAFPALAPLAPPAGSLSRSRPAPRTRRCSPLS